MTIDNELNKAINVLFAGRQPVWRHQERIAFAGAQPASVGAGVDVTQDDGAVVAFVGVQLRKYLGKKTFWLNIHNADAGQTFGVDITSPTSGNYQVDNGAGDATADAVIASLIAALEIDANFIADGGEVAQLGTSSILEMTFPESLAPSSMLVNSGGVAGVTYQSVIEEAEAVRWRLWGLSRDRADWFRLSDGDHIETASRGQAARFVRANGYDRLFIEVVESDGACLALVAPCYLDTDASAYVEAAAAGWTQHEESGLWMPTTTDGTPVVLSHGWDTSTVALSTASALIAEGGAQATEFYNGTGAIVYVAVGRAATVADYPVAPNGAWRATAQDGRNVGPVYGILSAGTGNVIVTRQES